MSCRRVAGAGTEVAGLLKWPQAGALERLPAAASPAENGPDLSQLLEQARTQGEAAGEARAEERWRARWEAEASKFARLAGEVVGWKARLRREAEREMLALALAIARRVVRREIQLDPGVLSGVLKAALERCDEREEVTVRVAAQEAELLRRHFERAGIAARFRLEADPALQPGSLWVETTSGVLDASAEAQLEEIERGLADRLAALKAGGNSR